MTLKPDNKVVKVPAVASELKQGESGERGGYKRGGRLCACSVRVRIHRLELDDKRFELRRC